MLDISKIHRITEFAKRIGRATGTVRRWEREEKLTAKRLPSGQRYFDGSDVRAMLGVAPDKRLTVVYCRVSRAGQRDDLRCQVAAMEIYCRAGAISVDEWIQEVGGGVNFRRKRFLSMIGRIGFDVPDHLSREHGCEIIVVNQESLSPEQEIAEGLLSIAHMFIREDFPGSRDTKDILA